MESFWTEKKVKKLKELLSKGLATSEIGKKLGVSKNTVIGKIHRLRKANELEFTKKNDKNKKDNNKSNDKKLFSFSFSKKINDRKKNFKSDITELEKSSEILIKEKIIIENKVNKKSESTSASSVCNHENDAEINEFLQDEQSFFRDKNKDTKYQLRDLKSDMCRWAYGEPNSSNFFFCGKKTIGNKPYCLKHAKMAYIIKKNDE